MPAQKTDGGLLLLGPAFFNGQDQRASPQRRHNRRYREARADRSSKEKHLNGSFGCRDLVAASDESSIFPIFTAMNCVSCWSQQNRCSVNVPLIIRIQYFSAGIFGHRLFGLDIIMCKIGKSGNIILIYCEANLT